MFRMNGVVLLLQRIFLVDVLPGDVAFQDSTRPSLRKIVLPRYGFEAGPKAVHERRRRGGAGPGLVVVVVVVVFF